MKHFTIALFLIGLGLSEARSQTIPNSGFETWGLDSFSWREFPLPWHVYTTIDDSATVTKSTDSHSGNYSVRLEAQQGEGVYFDLGVNSPLQPTGGVAPAYLNGYYKGTIAPFDSFGIAVDFTKSGMPGSVYTYTHATSSSNAAAWTPFHIPLSYPSGYVPDTFAFMMYTLMPTGTVVYLDDIAFSSTPIGNVLGNPVSSTGIRSVPQKSVASYLVPNPANGHTEISFMMLSSSNVRVNMYDMTGKLVKTLLDETKSYGMQKVQFDANELKDGMYFYTVSGNGLNETKKFVVAK